jgi:alpha-tubulin suppressor-like RCC1 family protein
VTCWGWNNTGQLGNGTLKPAYAPVAVSGLGTEPTASIASRANHTCALLTGGSVKCWGQNFDGQLGDGTSEHATAAVPVLGLGAGSTVAVAAGSQHTCALLANGAVRCWGLNKRGQLGDATTTDTDSPVPVGDLGGVALAVVTGGWHTCALLEAGTIQCWGRNAEGQLGDGTVVDRNSPVYVVGFGG